MWLKFFEYLNFYQYLAKKNIFKTMLACNNIGINYPIFKMWHFV